MGTILIVGMLILGILIALWLGNRMLDKEQERHEKTIQEILANPREQWPPVDKQ